MRGCPFILPGLLLLAAAPALLASARPGADPRPGDPVAGRKLYVAKGCVACHQPDGRGGIKLTGNPTPDWRDARRMADSTHDDDFLRDCIVNGRMKSGMVAWKKQLKPQEIEDLIALIRSFSRADSAKRPSK
jgi:mono/diheme cytochrome c family protein